MREWVDRSPERASARANALPAEADELEAKAILLRGEADQLLSTLSQERLRRSEQLGYAKSAILAALPNIRPEAWGEIPNLPAGRAIMQEYRVDRAFVLDVVREARA